MTMKSNLWLQLKVGTDDILLAAIIKLLAESGSTELPRELANLNLATVTTVTGVEKVNITRAADILCERKPTVIIYGSGVTRHPTAPGVIRAIRNLALTLGDTRIMLIPGEGNFVGSHDMGVHPAMLPGYQPLSDSKLRTAYGEGWKTTLNPNPGRNYEQMLTGIREKQIKALYLAGDLPPFPELANLSLLIIQDVISTANMQYAHVVFPSTTFAETDGTMTNLEGRIQRLHQAIPPVGQSRPGWMITKDLAEQIGDVHWKYESAEDVMDEIATTVPTYASVNYENLSITGALRRSESANRSFTGLPIHKPIQVADEEFPFTLITDRNLFHYYGASLTKHVKGMHLIKRSEILQLNASDAARLGVDDGARVKVESRHGVSEFNVKISDLPEGTAYTSIDHTVGSPLFATLIPTTKAYAVRIYPASQAMQSEKGGTRN
jgi:predicted molibdopterin-dependent oxidoreductase YjgC